MRLQQAKRATWAFLLMAVTGLAADNYVLPGARQEGSQLPVVATAMLTGTSAYGNPIVTPIVAISGSGVTITNANITTSGSSRAIVASTLTTSGTIAAGATSIDLTFSSDFVGKIIATGTVSLSGASLAGYTLRANAQDTLPALPLTVTSGTVGAITVR